MTIKDFITNELRKCAGPAFYDGYQFITGNMKYDVVEACGVYELRKSQELSITGFERNILCNCETTNHCDEAAKWGDYVQFNKAAERKRKALNRREVNARILREETARLEREAKDAADKVRAEQYEHIKRLVMAAKFKKQDITITLSKESIDEGLNLVRSAYCFAGLAVHKEAARNPKYSHYQLTHIASGFGLGFRFNSLAAAKTAAVRFAELTDWATADTKAIISTKAVTALARAIRDTGGKYSLDHDAMALVTEMDDKL